MTDEELWDMYIQLSVEQGVTIDRLFKHKEVVIVLLRVIEKYEEHTTQYKYANRQLAIIQLGLK